MTKKITLIINDWNPIEIYPLLDIEYDSEVKQIYELLTLNDTKSELAEKIYQVFEKKFGKLFQNTLIECEVIAEKILNALNN
ncbi:DUF1871 family protein [Paenibacillus shenyangensis]|uniref:DUF1871 family protein n=1 Tax=Paenibacillus sp. A9 TaxID=1284352 RepID=UPI000380301E|nr:DUF1871 family protein [Paenibacillus sp. A9]